jgi:hypothetical protein
MPHQLNGGKPFNQEPSTTICMGDASAFEWSLVLRFCYIAEEAKGKTQAHCCVHVYHVLNIINKEVKSSKHLLIQQETHKSERVMFKKAFYPW